MCIVRMKIVCELTLLHFFAKVSVLLKFAAHISRKTEVYAGHIKFGAMI